MITNRTSTLPTYLLTITISYAITGDSTIFLRCERAYRNIFTTPTGILPYLYGFNVVGSSRGAQYPGVNAVDVP